MQTFQIEVQDGRNGKWKPRKRNGLILAASANDALKNYGLRGSRPYNGQARSNTGKTFRAVLA